jgi:hypothetical protein
LGTIAKELDDFYRRIGGGLVQFPRSKPAPMNELSEQDGKGTGSANDCARCDSEKHSHL